MRIGKKVLFFVLLASVFAVDAPAQKAFRKIRQALKSAQYDEAIKQVDQCAQDSTLNSIPKLYNYAVDAYRGINDVENEKIYLKQAYDTARFFNSVKSMFDYALKCDKKEIEKGRFRFRNRNRELLLSHYPNLRIAGRYYYRKHDYTTALPYLEMYVKAASSPLLAGTDWARLDPWMPYIGYLSLKSCYRVKRYDDVLRYAELALQDSLHRGSTLYYMALTSRIKGNDGDYERFLRAGLTLAPGSPFFFTNLTDFYLKEGKTDVALALTDSMLRTKPDSPLYLYGKSLALMSAEHYAESIEAAKQALEFDEDLAEAYYVVGVCYYNLAVRMVRPDHVDMELYRKTHAQIRDYYAKARPYLETFRRLAPDESARWAPLLYRIYFSLNMGEQFEEIEQLMRTQKMR